MFYAFIRKPDAEHLKEMKIFLSLFKNKFE